MNIIKGKVGKFKKEEERIKKEVKERTIAYIIAAFGLVAGLAWNEAIRTLIENLFPISKNTVLAKFIYAVLMTFIVVVITVYLMRLIKKDEIKK